MLVLLSIVYTLSGLLIDIELFDNCHSNRLNENFTSSSNVNVIFYQTFMYARKPLCHSL